MIKPMFSPFYKILINSWFLLSILFPSQVQNIFVLNFSILHALTKWPIWFWFYSRFVLFVTLTSLFVFLVSWLPNLEIKLFFGFFIAIFGVIYRLIRWKFLYFDLPFPFSIQIFVLKEFQKFYLCIFSIYLCGTPHQYCTIFLISFELGHLILLLSYIFLSK